MPYITTLCFCLALVTKLIIRILMVSNHMIGALLLPNAVLQISGISFYHMSGNPRMCFSLQLIGSFISYTMLVFIRYTVHIFSTFFTSSCYCCIQKNRENKRSYLFLPCFPENLPIARDISQSNHSFSIQSDSHHRISADKPPLTSIMESKYTKKLTQGCRNRKTLCTIYKRDFNICCVYGKFQFLINRHHQVNKLSYLFCIQAISVVVSSTYCKLEILRLIDTYYHSNLLKLLEIYAFNKC